MDEEAIEYRVWMKHHESDGRALWLPISQLFSARHNAEMWARRLNTDDYRIEEEEA